ncbi:MAG: hypothetical protein RLZ04_1654, partial [Actinomycetota bacterium]
MGQVGTAEPLGGHLSPQAVVDTRSTMTFEEPPGCILTPSRLSPASIV